MKTCNRCGKKKPLSEFYKDKKNKRGYMHVCKECHKAYVAGRYDYRRDKDYQLRRKFGIGIEEYEAMLKSQNGVCAVCGMPETKLVKGTLSALAVDHDHVTGEVRGLLCHACNRGIGFFRDDPDLLEAASDYLRSQI